MSAVFHGFKTFTSTFNRLSGLEKRARATDTGRLGSNRRLVKRYHRRSQGGQRGHAAPLPKFLVNIVILCFESCVSEQNSGTRLKSNIFPPPKKDFWAGYATERYRRPFQSCSTLMHGNSSRAPLPSTRRQCSSHCRSSHVALGASKRKWAPQTIRDVPKGEQSECNETSKFWK